jgi:deazaflavin-dependent oxidoreductase (nitroreductase family)
VARANEFNQKTISEFHAKKGKGIQPWGDNLLLLTTRSAATGEEMTTPLLHRRDGDRLVVIASKGGAPEHPTWYRNVQVNPEVSVEVPTADGIEQLTARATVLPEGPERDRLYAYLTEVWPAFAEYEKKTERTIPVVLLEPN